MNEPNLRPTHEEVAVCAYFIYEAEGRPEDRALSHWLQAETQIVAARLDDAGLIRYAISGHLQAG